MPDNTLCPCGSGLAFRICCQPFLSGEKLAGSVEALMRSRYAAYVLEDEPYLLATWHPDTRPASLHFDQEPRPKWLGLTIKRKANTDDQHGLVEFVARYKINGRAFRMHETSRFERRDGRWLYRDGEVA
jgi:SEC-C motif-containing protein